MWQIHAKNKTAQSNVVSELLGSARTVMVASDTADTYNVEESVVPPRVIPVQIQ